MCVSLVQMLPHNTNVCCTVSIFYAISISPKKQRQQKQLQFCISLTAVVIIMTNAKAVGSLISPWTRFLAPNLWRAYRTFSILFYYIKTFTVRNTIIFDQSPTFFNRSSLHYCLHYVNFSKNKKIYHLCKMRHLQISFIIRQLSYYSNARIKLSERIQ